MNNNIKNIITIGTAAVPYIGGSISILIDKYIPSELEKRRNKLIEQFDKDIENLQEQISPGRLESEEYLTILFKIFKNAIEEHEQEKITRFRAILQNSALCEDIQNPEIEFYINLVNILTISHIKLLKIIYEGNFTDKVRYIHVLEDTDYALQRLCISELERLNLIYKSFHSPHTITSLGKRFFKFIELK